MSRLMKGYWWRTDADLCGGSEKTIHDEETSDVDLAESMGDLKVRFRGTSSESTPIPPTEQARGSVCREAAGPRERGPGSQATAGTQG